MVCYISEIGAIQKNAHLVDLEKMHKNEYLHEEVGVDTAENEPGVEVWCNAVRS